MKEVLITWNLVSARARQAVTPVRLVMRKNGMMTLRKTCEEEREYGALGYEGREGERKNVSDKRPPPLKKKRRRGGAGGAEMLTQGRSLLTYVGGDAGHGEAEALVAVLLVGAAILRAREPRVHWLHLGQLPL